MLSITLRDLQFGARQFLIAVVGAGLRAVESAAVTAYTLRHFRRQYPGLARDLTEVC